MKTLLHILLLTFITLVTPSCKFELFKPYVDKITISGTVSDSNKNLLDNVKITLYQDFMMSSGPGPVDIQYSKEGVFNFEYTPGSTILYYFLRFKKEGFREEEYRVSRSKAHQKCNIIMEKEY
ncbi:MAG: carboxypeptidase-like regulatory domain-containing protein [Prevotellaceae bacterium]|jgi:hypothetical protein|nr:carboxypeptidase-like regulatory domain-containing protein [Prevotellaceae bacterium]